MAHPLREWRKRRGAWHDRAGDPMTLDELATQVGVVPSQLSQIETGKRAPSLDLASRLSKLTSIPISDFVMKREAAE